MPKSLEDLENEMRVLKNEVQQALLDIREFLLTYVENPFGPGVPRGQSPAAGTLSSLSQGANGFAAGEQPEVKPATEAPRADAQPSKAAAGSGAGGSPPPVEVGAPAPGASGGQSISLNVQSTSGGPGVFPGHRDDGPEGTSEERPRSARPGQGGREGQAPRRQERATHGEEKWEAPGQECVEPPERAPDLATLALLAPWVEDGLRRVGRPALERVVSLYDDLGGVAPVVKKAVAHLLALSGDGADTSHAKPSLRQCLRLLADLDALLHRASRDMAGAALLMAYLGNGGADTRV
ncbi:MAG: hypothetical protein ACK4K2_00290 [Dehalococcoidia bacterium]